VAILLVVWCHLGVPPLNVDLSAVNTFAYSGVLLFFVLSGLLLFLPYARALINSAPWPSLRRFYARRVRRILPV
jgi:peptidoglycan/LPS O-acetylase OafA/YrhL